MKCEREWVSGIWGLLPKMVKVKDVKLLARDEKEISDKIFRDEGSNIFRNAN